MAHRSAIISGKGNLKIGLAREWLRRNRERRAVLTPQDAAKLRKQGLDIIVQEASQRIYSASSYKDLGVPVVASLRECDIILSQDPLCAAYIRPDKVYGSFSNHIKGGSYVPETDEAIAELGAWSFDFKRIASDRHERKVLHSKLTAAVAMMRALRAMGQKFKLEDSSGRNPFLALKPTEQYESFAEMTVDLQLLREAISCQGLAQPFVAGFCGQGNDGGAAIAMYDYLGAEELGINDLSKLADLPTSKVYKIIFQRNQRVRSLMSGAPFNLTEYNRHGVARYQSDMMRYLPRLSMLVMAIYWDERFPRLVTNQMLRELQVEPSALRLIVDFTGEANGPVESNVAQTREIYTYDPVRRERPGIRKRGVVMITDHAFAAALPLEASQGFSSQLSQYLPAVALAPYNSPFLQARTEMRKTDRGLELINAFSRWQGARVNQARFAYPIEVDL